MSEELEANVPVKLIGQSIGVNEGGVLMRPNLELTVKVKPTDIPETIDVDVTALKIGDSLTVTDIRDRVPVEIISDDDYVIATVVAPTPTATEEDTIEAKRNR